MNIPPRDNIRQKIKEILIKETQEYLNTDAERDAINLEIAIYNYAIKEATRKKVIKSWNNTFFRTLYFNRLRTIYFNLSPIICKSIQNKEIKAQEFPFLTHQEMCPEKWKDLIEKKIKRDDSRNTTTQITTDLFTCKKCGSKKCTYYELQIRSADEPATLFVSCLDCGKHWRQ